MCRTATKTEAPATLGVHHVLELYGCPAALLDDALLVSHAMEHAAAISETKLLDKLVHHFPAQGVTALALLAESHIAIHTWPELGYAAVDLFACGERARPWAGCAYLVQKLQARRYSLRTIRRGQTCEWRQADSPGARNSSPGAKAGEGDLANDAVCQLLG